MAIYDNSNSESTFVYLVHVFKNSKYFSTCSFAFSSHDKALEYASLIADKPNIDAHIQRLSYK